MGRGRTCAYAVYSFPRARLILLHVLVAQLPIPVTRRRRIVLRGVRSSGRVMVKVVPLPGAVSHLGSLP